MRLRAKIKRLVPKSILNNTLLMFPFLYKLSFVRYECNNSPAAIEFITKSLREVADKEGNIIECGCSRLGTTVYLAKFLKANNIQKHIYALDSFEGFLPDEHAKEREMGLNKAPVGAFTSTSLDYVTKKIARLGVDDCITPVKGFFQDTLEGVDSDWCLAFIDCDLKDSLMYCAEKIWPRLASGGYLLFDDYSSITHAGAKKGVDQWIAENVSEISEHGLTSSGVYYAVKK